MNDIYRRMTVAEGQELASHVSRVGATITSASDTTVVVRVSYDVQPGGSVRDKFVRDLPAAFGDAYAQVTLRNPSHFAVRMLDVDA